MLAGADPVAGTLKKLEPAFRDKLVRLLPRHPGAGRMSALDPLRDAAAGSLWAHDATELSRLFRDAEPFTPIEALVAVLARLEEVNPAHQRRVTRGPR